MSWLSFYRLPTTKHTLRPNQSFQAITDGTHDRYPREYKLQYRTCTTCSVQAFTATENIYSKIHVQPGKHLRDPLYHPNMQTASTDSPILTAPVKKWSSLKTPTITLYRESVLTGIGKSCCRCNSPDVFIPFHTELWACRSEVTGLKKWGTSTEVQARRNTMSLISILSSNVHLTLPSFPCPALTACTTANIINKWSSLAGNYSGPTARSATTSESGTYTTWLCNVNTIENIQQLWVIGWKLLELQTHAANGTTFLIWPRMPLTVRTAAPSKRATSNADVNISLMNAVFLKIL